MNLLDTDFYVENYYNIFQSYNIELDNIELDNIELDNIELDNIDLNKEEKYHKDNWFGYNYGFHFNKRNKVNFKNSKTWRCKKFYRYYFNLNLPKLIKAKTPDKDDINIMMI